MKALMVGIVGLVFVFGGTATVLESFGTISGTATVEEPTFYAGGSDSLYLEEDAAGHYPTDLTSLENETYSYTFEEVVGWYASEFDVRARIEDNSEVFNITMYLSYVDSKGDEWFICNKSRKIRPTSSSVTFDGCSMEAQSIQEFNLRFSSNLSDEEVHLEQSEKTFVEVAAK